MILRFTVRMRIFLLVRIRIRLLLLLRRDRIGVMGRRMMSLLVRMIIRLLLLWRGIFIGGRRGYDVDEVSNAVHWVESLYIDASIPKS